MSFPQALLFQVCSRAPAGEVFGKTNLLGKEHDFLHVFSREVCIA